MQAVMPLAGGQRNLGVQLTLFQPEGADYSQHITPCPPGFENLTTSLTFVMCAGIVLGQYLIVRKV